MDGAGGQGRFVDLLIDSLSVDTLWITQTIHTNTEKQRQYTQIQKNTDNTHKHRKTKTIHTNTEKQRQYTQTQKNKDNTHKYRKTKTIHTNTEKQRQGCNSSTHHDFQIIVYYNYI